MSHRTDTRHLEYAIRHNLPGVWGGGTSEMDRRIIIRRRRKRTAA